ncbi:MAG: hypothetical protein M1826_004603 [Phylliscum demangeonii]|nr:MAG: hypothetical protein M1826_004603 [Phylliscum demangeonii]
MFPLVFGGAPMTVSVGEKSSDAEDSGRSANHGADGDKVKNAMDGDADAGPEAERLMARRRTRRVKPAVALSTMSPSLQGLSYVVQPVRLWHVRLVGGHQAGSRRPACILSISVAIFSSTAALEDTTFSAQATSSAAFGCQSVPICAASLAWSAAMTITRAPASGDDQVPAAARAPLMAIAGFGYIQASATGNTRTPR